MSTWMIFRWRPSLIALRILESSLARQRERVAGAVGKVAEKIGKEPEDFLSIMGQFANDRG